MEAINREKADKVYVIFSFYLNRMRLMLVMGFIIGKNDFDFSPVHSSVQSRMNIPFR